MHDEHAENVGAYALGALPALEAQLFEGHLAGCDSCRGELQRASQAAAALARSVVQFAPPPSLKESLMAAVEAEAASVAEPSRAARARKPARRSWLPRLRPAIALAAASAAVAFGAGTLLTQPAEPRTVAAAVDQGRLPDGTASLLIPEDEDRGAILRVQGLPDPGRGRIYQVWVQRGEEVVPVSIFDVDSKGSGAAAIPHSLDGVSAVMVTRERRGGATAPSEKPAITADV
jgi:anti-sigma-K factor RskA